MSGENITAGQGMTVAEVLQKEGRYVGVVSGVSMYPMLRHKKDIVVIEPPHGRLKKHDVALYQVGERYVLHRVVKVTSDGYHIRGDNCYRLEKDIAEGQVVGVLTSFYRGSSKKPVNLNGVGYLLYVWGWRVLYPIRYVLAVVKRKILGK